MQPQSVLATGLDRCADSLPAEKLLAHVWSNRDISFLVKAHDGLADTIAERSGFKDSGLRVRQWPFSATAMPTRLHGPNSSTCSSASCTRPLVDGDSGFGTFNNARLLVHTLRQCGAAGVAPQDSCFPRMNSFVGERHPQAYIDEFSGPQRAVRDIVVDDLVPVGWIEARIAGYGMDENFLYGRAYADAGVNAILVHSRVAQEMLRHFGVMHTNSISGSTYHPLGQSSRSSNQRPATVRYWCSRYQAPRPRVTSEC